MFEEEPEREYSMPKKVFQFIIYVAPYFQPCPSFGRFKIVEAPSNSAFRDKQSPSQKASSNKVQNSNRSIRE